MYIEFAALAGGALFLAAVLIRDDIRARSKMQEIEAQLEGMHEELNVLLLQEWRRPRTEYATRKAEAPEIDSQDAPAGTGGEVVGKRLAALKAVSIELETWMRTLSWREARHSFSGAKIFLIMSMIAGTIAVLLVYIFAFERSPPKTSVATVSATSSIAARPAATVPSPQAPPAMIESQGVPANVAAEHEVEAPSLQTTRRLEAAPNDSAVTAQQPMPDLKSTRGEIGTTDDGNAALSNPSPSSEPSSQREAQERLPLETDIATVSTKSPAAAQPAMPAPLPQAGSPSTEPQGIAAKMEAEPEVQTPPVQSTTRPDSNQNDSTAEITTLQPTPHLEMPSTDNRTTDDRPIAETPPIREAHPGVLTRCVVNLIPSGQIAVQHATSYQTCISAGTKCAGSRRYADIQFFVQPSLTSTNSAELCEIAP